MNEEFVELVHAACGLSVTVWYEHTMPRCATGMSTQYARTVWDIRKNTFYLEAMYTKFFIYRVSRCRYSYGIPLLVHLHSTDTNRRHHSVAFQATDRERVKVRGEVCVPVSLRLRSCLRVIVRLSSRSRTAKKYSNAEHDTTNG